MNLATKVPRKKIKFFKDETEAKNTRIRLEEATEYELKECTKRGIDAYIKAQHTILD